MAKNHDDAQAQQTGQMTDSKIEAVCRKALAVNPSNANALSILGTGRLQRGDRIEGMRLLEQSLQVEPNQPVALYNLGRASHTLHRYVNAISYYDRAIALRPTDSAIYYNRGNTLRELCRYEEAADSFLKAVQLDPTDAHARCNLGSVLQDMRRFTESLDWYQKALQINPNLLEAIASQGNAFINLKRYDEAISCFDQAIKLDGNHAPAYYSRAEAFRLTKQYELALTDYERAAAIAPELSCLLGSYLHTKLLVSSWKGLDALYATLARESDNDKLLSSPFVLLSSPASPDQQQKCAELYLRDMFPPHPTRLWNGEKYEHDKIRIVYLSADFREHAISYLIAELIETHNRDKFEIIGCALDVSPVAGMRKRLAKAFDKFIEGGTISDEEMAKSIRSLEADIVVDLNGLTEGSRPGILARRPAPVQVNYLGYPGTMPSPYIDYIIADHIVIPAECRQWYSEKVAYLPNSYQANDSSRAIFDVRLSRKAQGLPDEGFVFCCFNNSHKISPDVFDIWMRLLRKVPGSVLWLLPSSALTARNLEKEAVVRGVSPARLVFADYVDQAAHLLRYPLADLFLDTFHYNAHTTTSDALWAGVPVITCPGQTFASRVAASLLNATGLQELVTASREDYESRAQSLALDPSEIQRIRNKLRRNRKTCALFDTQAFCAHLEKIFVNMWERSKSGLLPADIEIEK